MPRIRTIKPEAWRDGKVGAVSLLAELLWVKLISFADDAGRFPADIGSIAGFAYPRKIALAVADDGLEAWLTELVDEGLVVLYASGDERYGVIPKFHEHQVINKPTQSRLPEPPLSVPGALRYASERTPAHLPDDYGSPTVALETPENTGLPEGSRSPTVLEHGSRNTDLGTGISSSGDAPTTAIATLEKLTRGAGSELWEAAWWGKDERPYLLELLNKQPGPVQESIATFLLEQHTTWETRTIRFGVEYKILPAALKTHEAEQERGARAARRGPAAAPKPSNLFAVTAPPPPAAAKLWTEVIAAVPVDDTIRELWLGELRPIDLDDSQLTVGGPEHIARWVRDRMLDALAHAAGRPVRVVAARFKDAA